jgi:hypothetical protein
MAEVPGEVAALLHERQVYAARVAAVDEQLALRGYGPDGTPLRGYGPDGTPLRARPPQGRRKPAREET